MDFKEEILEHSDKYLKSVLPGYNKLHRFQQFSCPKCSQIACTFIPGTIKKMNCKRCGWTGDIIDLVKEDNPTFSETECLDYIVKYLGLKIVTPIDIDNILKLYERLGFDLIKVTRLDKTPFEKDWPNKPRYPLSEWSRWLDEGLNIGVKTGKTSNIIILDIDSKTNIPKEIKPFLQTETLIQETENGYHIFFEYDDDLADSKNFRPLGWDVEIKSNGTQVVLYPSKVYDKKKDKLGLDRHFNLSNGDLFGVKIAKMPLELKKVLLDKLGDTRNVTTLTSVQGNTSFADVDSKVIDEVAKEMGFVPDGGRHHALMHLGGVLKKEMNYDALEHTMATINKYFCHPPLSSSEFRGLMGSFDKYLAIDENSVAKKIIDYLSIVEDSSEKEIREVIQHKKIEIEKALKLLTINRFVYKKKSRYYIIKKMMWNEALDDGAVYLNYKIPYFDDIAHFTNGDMLVVGAKTGVGKSHISLNIIKQFVTQGIKPYYISLESGSRYKKIAKDLCLKEGDFFHGVHFNPMEIKLEKNAVTVIDWLLPDNYAETDKLYKHFAEQLSEQKGILIVFAQLMENGAWFSQNMIKMFPALAAKFLYEVKNGQDDYENSYFLIEKIREPKGKFKYGKVLTKYNWQTKELVLVT